jgi:hypothetical protein
VDKLSAVKGTDVVAVPMSYYDEFRRDPIDALLKFGSLPQRARAPWFTDVAAINRAMTLPDMVTGPRAVLARPKSPAKSIVAGKDVEELLEGISPHFSATDDAYWHVHVDLALNKKRHGDAAGIAMGRIVQSSVETFNDPNHGPYERVMRNYEVPLVAQIIAPVGDQVYITSVGKLILALKQIRHFNITSFSFDGWQSADIIQQLMLAGLVTAGVKIDDATGEFIGIPKSWSVDGRAIQPYRELLEAVNDDRITLPDYGILKQELKQIEVVEPGLAPDHAVGGSKDVADPVAGVVGYLAAFGHAILFQPPVVTREDLEEGGYIEPSRDFGLTVEGERLALGVEDPEQEQIDLRV